MNIRRLLPAYAALLSLGALAAAASLLATRSAQGGVGGFSAARLAVAALLLVPAVLLAWNAWRLAADPAHAERLRERLSPPRVLAAGTLVLLAGWIGWYLDGFAPLAPWADYLVRLRPLAAWLAWAGALTCLLACLLRPRALPPLLEKPALRLTLILLGIFAAAWVFIALSGLGLRIREDYWYGAGVPALPAQVLISLAAGLLAHSLERKFRSGSRLLRLDLLLSALAWGGTALLWAREPLRASYFMPGPSVPARDFYPFSDATLFDIGSQFALIGQGLFNRQYFDRVLYSAFLTYLHGAAGQNYIQLMAIQAAILAAFAMILYLIGREMGSRTLGASMAVLTALRGVNSIAGATWIDLSGPKMVLTDFPAAVLLALLTLLLIRWLKDPLRRWHLALWSGCVLSLGVMLRTNVLTLLPVILLMALAAYRPRWRAWAAASALLIAGMLLTTLPWDMVSHARGGPLLGTYFMRIEIIIRDRYGIPLGSLPEQPASVPAPHTAVPALIEKADCASLVCQGINHFFHNLEASALVLPVSPAMQSLRQTVKEAFPFWDKQWFGQGFRPEWGVGLAFNLALIALGLGAAWGRRRWIGLIPLAVYLGYLLSDSFALTSGGRYIVPADWVACLYFLAGALAVAEWALRAARGGTAVQAPLPDEPLISADPRSSLVRRGLLTAVLIVLVGSLIPLSERPFPLRYVDYTTRQQGFDALKAGGLLEGTGIPLPALRRFLQDPQAAILDGRALYPRHFQAGSGLIGGSFPYQEMGFPRLAFTLIGPAGMRGVVLPGDVPAQFANASDVIVLGCRTARNIDALLVYVASEPRAIYTRSPAAPLTCPLRTPVCLDKETCR